MQLMDFLKEVRDGLEVKSEEKSEEPLIVAGFDKFKEQQQAKLQSDPIYNLISEKRQFEIIIPE